MIIVLDTNVLVSGLLNGSGISGQIVDLVFENRVQIAYDDRILGEYEDILTRPKFAIETSKAISLVAQIEISGLFINAAPLSPNGYQDTDDLAFAEVFITANAQALVTGNLRHFTPLIQKGLPVYSPAQFLERFFIDR